MRAAVDREALTVAMALVPGMYARNRLFALFREPEVRRAKARAAMIRGVVRQLSGAQGAAEGLAFATHGDVVVLRYRVPSMRLERRVEMTEAERACLMFLAARAGVGGVQASADDRAKVESVLKRLGADTPAGGASGMTASAAAAGSEPARRQSEGPPR
jgi:hypothetical protein